MGDSNQAGPGRKQGGQGIEVEGAVSEMDRHSAHYYTALCEVHPWGDVGVVVEVRDEHFVAGREGTAQRAANAVGQGGHVRSECDLVGRGSTEEGSHVRTSQVYHLVGALAGEEQAAMISVRGEKVVANAVNRMSWDLGARR